MMKLQLLEACKLFAFCNDGGGLLYGYLTPEIYRDRVLANKTNDELIELKNEYEKSISFYASNFHPDECQCGIMRGLSDKYWFVDELGVLGYITLYSNYIKTIDEILKRMEIK